MSERSNSNNDRTVFEIRDRARGAHRTFVLSGELDMAGGEELQSAVRQGCEEGTDDVALDLSELTFIDSTGLRAVVSVHDLCRERGVEVALIPGGRAVQRVFELTGLAAVLPFRREPSA
jgi:anti-anti-sigma factor